jgi:hypothetical protein
LLQLRDDAHRGRLPRFFDLGEGQNLAPQIGELNLRNLPAHVGALGFLDRQRLKTAGLVEDFLPIADVVAERLSGEVHARTNLRQCPGCCGPPGSEALCGLKSLRDPCAGACQREASMWHASFHHRGGEACSSPAVRERRSWSAYGGGML